MKFQDDISNMNTYVRTDKPKPICPPPHFFKVGGIKSENRALRENACAMCRKIFRRKKNILYQVPQNTCNGLKF